MSPKPPKPLPPLPREDQAATAVAAERQRRLAARGYQSTILTNDYQTALKTKTGEGNA